MKVSRAINMAARVPKTLITFSEVLALIESRSKRSFGDDVRGNGLARMKMDSVTEIRRRLEVSEAAAYSFGATRWPL